MRAKRIAAAVAAAFFVGGAATAAAASEPAAITGPVASVGSTTASVTGTVDPNGVSTTWFFEYGTSTSYGSKTSSVSAGSGTGSSNVSAALKNLASGTSYHYRLVATSSAGTSHGADGVFTTTSAPAVVTASATAVGSTSATLGGTVDPNGRATTWFVEYGTTTSYGSKTSDKSAGSGSTAVSVSVEVSGLERGRTYHYRLVATSDAGTSKGADKTFSTSTAPSVLTAAASSVAPTSATLNGTVTPNGQGTSWHFEYGTTTGYGSKTSSHNAGSGTSAVNTSATVRSLKTGTTYHFRLVASNGSGTSYGADQSFSTASAPLARTGAAQAVGGTTATLTASINPNGRSTTWYFEYGTTTGYGSKTPAKNAGSATADVNVVATIAGLSSGTTYHYRLVASSDAGTSRGSDLSFRTGAVTLTALGRRVVLGRAVMLSGLVPTSVAGETVTILAQRSGEDSFHPIATVVTADGGVWRYRAMPSVRTAYQASWQGGLSAVASVGVRPLLSFRRIGTSLFVVRAAPSASFAGRVVQLQRRTSFGRWVTIRHMRLGQTSTVRFTWKLQRGTARLRIAMSVNQAGIGYLGGFSRPLAYRRR